MTSCPYGRNRSTGRGSSFGRDPSLAIVPLGGFHLLPNFHAKKKFSIFFSSCSGTSEFGLWENLHIFGSDRGGMLHPFIIWPEMPMGLTADESDAGQQEHGRRLINRPDKRTTVETITVVLPLKTAAAARRGKFWTMATLHLNAIDCC